MDWDSPPSIADTIKAIVGLAISIASFRGWRSGALSRLWENAVALLAAPVERDLARRETKAVNYENTRLTKRNEELELLVVDLESQITILKSQVTVLLVGHSSTGFSSSEDGTQTRP